MYELVQTVQFGRDQAFSKTQKITLNCQVIPRESWHEIASPGPLEYHRTKLTAILFAQLIQV